MNKFKFGYVLNILLIILELIAVIITVNSIGLDLSYYTIDSNLFALIAAVLYLLTRNDVPNIVLFFKYSSTLSLLITFLVVIFILYPMLDFNFQFLFLDGPNIYFHVLCPLIALISFLYFEKNDLENSWLNNLRAVYFTIIYAIILISLNILKIVSGPYPFLKVYEQSVLMSIFWIVVMIGGALLLSRLIMVVKELNNILNL